MIKVTLNDILNATEAFSNMMTQSVKGSVAFKIARLARELNKESETFNVERQKMLETYCVKKDSGELDADENGNVKILPDKIGEFNQEFQALLDTEVEINADKLSLDTLDEFDLTPQQMIFLEKFFE